MIQPFHKTKEFYIQNPDLRDYFLTLSPALQDAVVESEVCISSLGELQMWVEHYTHQP